jgi:hypothetical protein
MRNFIGLVLVLVFSSTLTLAQVPGKVPDKYGKTYADNAYARFGNSEDVVFGYNTTQTADAMVFGLSTDSETMILMQKADIGTDMGLADLGTPSLVIANSDPTKYFTLSHDGTNTVVDSSTGVVSFPDGVSGALNGTLGATTPAAVAATTVAASSTIVSSATGTIGWSVVSGANTACTTTCTNACVFGVNTAATEADIVACSDATADKCLCAGAN